MRILIVDHNAVHPLNQAVYRQLSEAGTFTIRIVIPMEWHDTYRTVRGEAVRVSDRCDVVPLPVFFPARTHRLIYRGLGRIIREFSPDVLYINAEPENFQTLQASLLLRRFPDVRLVFSSWRNIDYASHSLPYKLSTLHAGIEQHVLVKARGGIAFTASAQEIFTRNGFDRMTLIPPEVDTSLFMPLKREAGRGSTNFTVGYAGRLHAHKGVDLLLKALVSLPDDVRLLVAGSGPAEGALKAMAEAAGIAGRIEWKVPVLRSDMPGLLAALDVVVLPSRSSPSWSEQFGRILIEAMACGIPVVGSSSGEIPEVIGDAGIVFAEDDSTSLRAAILHLKDDDHAREDAVRKGLERVNRRHELSRIVSLYEAFFTQLSNRTQG